MKEGTKTEETFCTVFAILKGNVEIGTNYNLIKKDPKL
jgi:hypothetical protein